MTFHEKVRAFTLNVFVKTQCSEGLPSAGSVGYMLHMKKGCIKCEAKALLVEIACAEVRAICG